jgi:stearoyl-CoA desaturase (delta-9 desaturase)
MLSPEHFSFPCHQTIIWAGIAMIDKPECYICCRYFSLFKLLFCFIIPVVVPPLLWDERWYASAMGIGVIRYILLLNAAWSVNSLAHIWGSKPYDR